MNEEFKSDYLKYRGKCKEMSEELCRNNPTLRLVRGHYYCPIWNTNEPHWWCVTSVGDIIDPTRLQFPSAGLGEYKEFDGKVSCDNCGKMILEEEASRIEGNYVFCCGECYAEFVGIDL